MKTSVTRNPNGTPESTSVGSHTFVRTIIKYSCQIASMTTRLAVARTQSEGVKLLAVASTRRRLRPMSNVEATQAVGLIANWCKQITRLDR